MEWEGERERLGGELGGGCAVLSTVVSTIYCGSRLVAHNQDGPGNNDVTVSRRIGPWRRILMCHPRR